MPNAETPRFIDADEMGRNEATPAPHSARLLTLTNIGGVVCIDLNQTEVQKLTADQFITLLGSLEAVKHKVYALSEVAYDDSDGPVLTGDALMPDLYNQEEVARLRDENQSLRAAIDEAADAYCGEGHEFDQAAVADALMPWVGDHLKAGLAPFCSDPRS